MAENTKNEWQDKEVGVLWKREKKSNGEKFLTGKLDLKKLVEENITEIIIFQNKKKQKPEHPDLRIYKSEPRENRPAPANATAETAAPVKKAAAPKAAAPAPEASPEGDNEII